MAAQRLVNEEIHKQINLEAVWVATEDAIQQTHQTEKIDASNEASELNEDWLNYLISHAEKASSANLRKLWGQILAREIRKPGSSSLSALRVLSEMDAELAGAFQEVMIRRIASDAILKPDAREGQALVKITTLLETGLLFDNALGLSLKMSGVPGSVEALIAKNFALQFHFTENVKEISVPIMRITHVGQQIANILPWDEVAALKEAAKTIVQNMDIKLVRISYHSMNSSSGVEFYTANYIENVKTAIGNPS